MNRRLIARLLLVAACALSVFGCTATANDPLLDPLSPAAVAGKSVAVLVSDATRAYLDYKDGNIDWAWAITQGAQTYQTLVKTSGDVKNVVKAWGGNTGDSQKFADRLTRIFRAKGVTDPKEQARILAEVVPVAIAQKSEAGP